MSLAEVYYRFKKTTYISFQKQGFFRASEMPEAKLLVPGNFFITKPVHIDHTLYCKAADEVIKGKLAVFALNDAQLGTIPCWNKEPRSGVVAPLNFGKTLNYRNPDLVGDIKYLWEPNRHLQLVVLAQAYSLTENQCYLDAIKIQLGSWFEQCPYLMGPNWTSSLELGIRLINWSIVWQLIGGAESRLFQGDAGEKFRLQWLTSIYQHVHFIIGHMSRFSSANNHLIGEAAGVFVAAVTWPHWQQFAVWRNKASEILEAEAAKQTSQDGVNREQAVSYQQFVLDFLLVSALAGRASGDDFSEQYWCRIELMMDYLASIMDVQGHIPMIGDADDGFVVLLSREKTWCPYRSLLATGAVLFSRGELKKKSIAMDDKTRWLLGLDVDSQYDSLKINNVTLPVNRKFKDGGYYILGADFETSDEIRLIVDAGPLGYESIAAHGHADALSFTLSIGGDEFLVDPGTYAYHTQKKWRDYFRGTSAHNAVRIDGMDQSESGGNFMWLRKANSHCELFETDEKIDRFTGSHDGYENLADPVTHSREIVFDKIHKVIHVIDHLACEGKHEVECFWHFSEYCTVKISDSKLEAQVGDRMITLKSDTSMKANPVLVKGDEQLPLGWVSRRYDVKTPSQSAYWRYEINGNTSIKTEIYCN